MPSRVRFVVRMPVGSCYLAHTSPAHSNDLKGSDVPQTAALANMVPQLGRCLIANIGLAQVAGRENATFCDQDRHPKRYTHSVAKPRTALQHRHFAVALKWTGLPSCPLAA
jgi:hypothetical protein